MSATVRPDAPSPVPAAAATPDALRPIPPVIQGGMGVGVSGWRLARAVARAGQLGVISGTAIDTVLVRRLQDGDADGSVRRAMAAFPWPAVAEEALRRFFRPEGKAPDAPYVLLPMYRAVVTPARERLAILAAFVEVWLAREGHDGMVGMNLLTKVQFPTLPLLYGAMLAGVDVVLMGAGIPREIPGALDVLALHAPAKLKLDVDEAAPGEPTEWLTFDPAPHWAAAGLPVPAPLLRPRFLPIVSAATLATNLARKSTGRVDGFIVEGWTAGGHNAPPRGAPTFDAEGQPVYGTRDVVDMAAMRALELPFWLAGGTGSPQAYAAARAEGAAGVQVGTLFAFCEESGLAPEVRARTLAAVREGTVRVRTDPRASPTGFPFKLVHGGDVPMADPAARKRVCDLGYLRTARRRPDGRLDYRCAAEPVEDYVAKGGDVADTVGRRCLCNGLLADIGHGQVREWGDTEAPLVTAGDDLMTMGPFLGDRAHYGARDVLTYLLGAAAVPAAETTTGETPAAARPDSCCAAHEAALEAEGATVLAGAA